MSLYAVDLYSEPSLTPTGDQIAALYAQRRLQRGPELSRMQEVQQMYDGDIVVPLPELNRNERSSIPNRVKNGLTQFSERIASALPSIQCRAVRVGIKESEQRARDRRSAILGWWDYTEMKTVLRQRARYLQGYGAAPVQIRWDTKAQVPVWEHRNPLTTFPSHLRGPEDMCPADCIFETSQPLWWLQDKYPGPMQFVAKPAQCKRDQLFTVLEYADAQVCVLVVLGQRDNDLTTPAPGSMAVQLERYPNRSEQCPVVIPRQVSLSKPHGQFDGMYGMYQTEAMLTALGIIATQKGVFGEHWLVSASNSVATIVQVPDVAEGIPGIVKDGALQRLGPDPQFQTNLTVDRLAAAQNEQAGITSELQGQAGTNIRTGARANALLSNVIDFPLQEAQELFEQSLQMENRRAIAFTKAYGDGPKSFYVHWTGENVGATYKPDEVFEIDHNRVRYPLAGADQAGLVISGGQRVGMGTLSKRSFMKIDPLVEDDELEHDSIISEHLEEAVLASISQQAAAGQIPPSDVARIAELVLTNKQELFAAITTAHEEAQARQAQQVPAESPEAQPGIAQPGMGAEAGTGQQPPLDLASALASLRRPQQGMTPQEQMASGPAA